MIHTAYGICANQLQTKPCQTTTATMSIWSIITGIRIVNPMRTGTLPFGVVHMQYTTSQSPSTKSLKVNEFYTLQNPYIIVSSKMFYNDTKDDYVCTSSVERSRTATSLRMYSP
jgi:hypothetical protein